MNRFFFAAQCGLLCAASLLGQTKTGTSATTATKKAAAPATGTKKAAAAPASRANLMNPASLNAKAPESYNVKFVTTKGDVVIAVTRSWAPLGADRFYNLVKNGYFTNTAFYRIVPGFVVQWGFSPNPAINRVWEKASIQDDPVTQSNRRGTIVFATSGPNTRTTQLFINLADNARLDGMGFAAFGQVTSGLDAIDKLNSEYGEKPEQGEIATKGAAYLNKEFPNLDLIKSATIIGNTPASPNAPMPKPTPK